MSPVAGGLVAFVTLSAVGLAPAAAAPPDAVPASIVLAEPGTGIPGAYIVTLRPGTLPRRLAAALAVAPRYIYDNALTGFAARLTQGQVQALQRRPEVESIEQDQIVVADAAIGLSPQVSQATPLGGGLYGLDRIDQRVLPLSGTYSFTSTGPSVSAYVLDSGIATSHPDFGGRASNVFDALGGDGQDCNGHGTHVAGTIGGATHGVAKAVRLRGVRVLSCGGSGSISSTLAGVNWVRANAVKPAVANMSLAGGLSTALNRAVESLADSGVAVAVAASNSSADACKTSPASAKGVITVAASDRVDARAPFSNFGGCVDIYAPGVDIRSTWLGGGTLASSGTSMASPHVAGAVALYKSAGDRTSVEVNAWVVNTATNGVIQGNPPRTPNRLLFSSS